MGGVSLAVLVLGWFLGYEELLALGIAGVVIVLVALGWSAYRPQVEAHRQVQPDRVTVGDAALGVLTVVNPGRRSTNPMVAEESFGGDVLEVAIPRLKPGESRSTPYELPTQRRGVITVGPLVLRRGDPFGLVASGKSYGELATLWVHPKVHALGALPSGRSRDLEGPTSDNAPQGGMAFHTLREYVHGDDLRQIHWRSSARTGTLMVRHMVDSSQPVTAVVLDTRRDRYTPDRFEAAIEAAASVIVACKRQNFPVSFHTTDGVSVGAQGQAATTTEFLDRLAGLDWTTGDDVATLARKLSGHGGGGSLVFLTGKPDLRDLPVISRVRRSFDATVVVRFHDEVEITLGDDGELRSAGGIPGASVINAVDVRVFVNRWNRMVRA